VQEVAQHNKRNDCWIIVDGKVYDITTYVDDHVGGDAILNNAGGDSTVGFHGPQHPPDKVRDIITDYYIGNLVPSEHNSSKNGKSE
jgi:cytochrome b involved in lipid metabolism